MTLEELKNENERLREKNRELNRRCTNAEGAARDILKGTSGGSVGRGLLRWAASDLRREVERLKKVREVAVGAMKNVTQLHPGHEIHDCGICTALREIGALESNERTTDGGEK